MENEQESILDVAILGGGEIARKAYLPLLRTWYHIRIVGLFSRTQETVDDMCAAWQIDFGTTELEALLARRPQAAFVLTAQSSHAALVRALLEAGVDVYVEKPATESSAATRELADLAKAKGRLLMVGFNRRHALLYRQAREVFAGHRPQICVIEKHRPSAYHVSLYDNYLDDTIHQIDLLRFFCGDARPIHTSFEMRDGKLVGALSVAALQTGGLAVVLTSLQAGAWQERVALHGDGLTVEVNAFRELRVKAPQREEIYGLDRPGRWVPELVERGFHGAVKHFFECVRERRIPESDGYEAAQTQELLEAMVTAAGQDPRPSPHPR
jgi:virulence factor